MNSNTKQTDVHRMDFEIGGEACLDIIAVVDGRVVGICHVAQLETKIAWIEKLYVAPQYRAQGIGSRMLQAVFAECVIRGKEAVSLSVDEDNFGAIVFYKKNCFRRSTIYANGKASTWTKFMECE